MEDIRTKIALRLLDQVQIAIEENGNVYTRSLVPNLTSVRFALNMSLEDLIRGFRTQPGFRDLFS